MNLATMTMGGSGNWSAVVALLALILGLSPTTQYAHAGGGAPQLSAFGATRKRVTLMDKAGQFTAALVALIVGWMGDPPQILNVLVMSAIFLFALDYCTAHQAARLAGELITTRKIREMTSAKLLSYGISVAVIVCFGVMLRSWLPIVGIFGWINYCESVSNLENVRKSAYASGSMGSIFSGGVARIADKFLGELPGVKDAGGDITISQTTTTDRATTTTTQTDTQVHVSPGAPPEPEVGS